MRLVAEGYSRLFKRSYVAFNSALARMKAPERYLCGNIRFYGFEDQMVIRKAL